MDDVIAVVTDLFFQSRVAAAARQAGRDVRFVSPDVKNDDGFNLALVDLDAAGDVIAAIRRLKANGAPIVAFGPHLDTERRKAARGAGADRVLAKSKFVTELSGMMRNDSGSGRDRVSAELAEYGRRMEELGRLLQDPGSARRVYLAPDPHMEEAQARGDPIILNSADYLGFLAVDSLRSKLHRLRETDGETGAG